MQGTKSTADCFVQLGADTLAVWGGLRLRGVPAQSQAAPSETALALLALAASPATDEPSGLSPEEREGLAVLRWLEQVREEKGTRSAA